MEASLFLAKVFGLVFPLIGLTLLLNLKHFKKMVSDFAAEYALIYVSGIFLFFIGVLGVLYHNVWEGEGWQILVTIFVWILLLKGAVLVLFPKMMKKTSKAIKGDGVYVLGAIAILAAGLYLAYVGFYM